MGLSWIKTYDNIQLYILSTPITINPLVVYLALHSSGAVVNKDLRHQRSAAYWSTPKMTNPLVEYLALYSNVVMVNKDVWHQHSAVYSLNTRDGPSPGWSLALHSKGIVLSKDFWHQYSVIQSIHIKDDETAGCTFNSTFMSGCGKLTTVISICSCILDQHQRWPLL